MLQVGPRASSAKATTQPGPNPSPSVHGYLSPSPGRVGEETPDEHSHGTSPSITMDGVKLFWDGLGTMWEWQSLKRVNSQVPVSLSLYRGLSFVPSTPKGVVLAY